MSKPKTVLLLIETLNRGGIETVLLRLIPQLKEAGWESIVVTIRDGGEMLSEYEQAGIRVVPLGQKNFLSPLTWRLISHQVRLLQPDLIMTNLFKADVIGRIYLRFVVPQPVIPYLVTTYNHPRYWIARVFEWLTKPLADNYIANSRAVQEFYQTHLGIDGDRIVVAQNGVDTKMFQRANDSAVRAELSLPSDAFVVTCVANLAPNKGQADLLAAFDQIFGGNPKAFLLLVGDGEEREALKAQREALRSKDRIILLGRRTDVPSILKATTVFALPTLFEGMSTALLEAMAAGKAIVTTDIPENKVLLTDNQSALMFRPRDRQGLADALKRMADEPALRERLSQAAYRFVEENFSITKMAETFATTFDRIGGYRGQTKTPIIHLINSLESGGAENMLLRTLPLLNGKEFEHIVITLFRDGELSPEFTRRGIEVINIGSVNNLDFPAWRRLARQIKALQPGLVITYLFHASLIGRLYLQRRITTPVIPFLRSTYNFPRYFIARLFERLTKGLVDHYFANSQAVKDYYVKHIGVREPQITVIPSGIDVARFENSNHAVVTEELQLPDNRVVITCVANLAPNKGHRYLLEAFETIFRTHPTAYLLLIGEGEERQNLEHQISSYQSKQQIKFLGRRHDVPDILAITDIFVLPTLFEGLSNALLEAMAAGCAVVTTDIPENRVMITDNQTGLLVPTENSQSLERAITEVIDDQAKRQRLGAEAKQFIRDNFDLSRVAELLDQAVKKYAHDPVRD